MSAFRDVSIGFNVNYYNIDVSTKSVETGICGDNLFVETPLGRVVTKVVLRHHRVLKYKNVKSFSIRICFATL